MSAQNKVAMRRIYEEIWNEGRFDVLEEIVSPNYVGHLPMPPSAPSGREGLAWLIETYRNAFPDIHVQVEDQFAEGDKVMTRITIRGTHQGQFMQIPPTGREVSVSAIVVTRFENGLNVEGWAELDRFKMMQQLGIIPTA